MNPALVVVMTIGAMGVVAIARSRAWSAPLILVLVGFAVSLLPWMPRVEIMPELILGLVLPPLLFSAALQSSYLDFRDQLRSITRLGLGLVAVTTITVGLVAWWLLGTDNFPLAAAFALGAIVAPPDAVAASAVARRLGLPRRVMTLLSGESLINDAASLTLYKVALSGVLVGGSLWREGLQTFAIAIAVGIAVGAVIGVVVHAIRTHMDDAVMESVIALAAPFIAYLLAEELLGSGVLAVVTAGLYLGYTAPTAGYATRLQEKPVWESLDLILESLTFGLIGLQLKWVVLDVINSHQGLGAAVLVSVGVLITAILIRPIYIFATNWMDAARFPWTRKNRLGKPNWRETVVVSWAGMRGVVTLAAAAAIPLTTNNGEPFPERATLQMAAFTVAIGTLLLQGSTLPWIIRTMKLESDDTTNDALEEARARRLAADVSASVVQDRAHKWAASLGPEAARHLADSVAERVRRRMLAAAAILERSIEETSADEATSVHIPRPSSDEGPTDDDRSLTAIFRAPTPPQRAAKPDMEQAATATKNQETRDVDTHKASPQGQISTDPVDAEARRPCDHAGRFRPSSSTGARRKGAVNIEAHAQRAQLVIQLERDIIAAKREVLLQERDAGRLNETVQRRLQRELDLEEETLTSSWINRL